MVRALGEAESALETNKKQMASASKSSACLAPVWVCLSSLFEPLSLSPALLSRRLVH